MRTLLLILAIVGGGCASAPQPHRIPTAWCFTRWDAWHTNPIADHCYPTKPTCDAWAASEVHAYGVLVACSAVEL